VRDLGVGDDARIADQIWCSHVTSSMPNSARHRAQGTGHRAQGTGHRAW
jgi:hypothetical protein